MADEVEVFVVEGPDLCPAVKLDSNDVVVAHLVAAPNVATMKLLLPEINIREGEKVWVLREHNARLYWVKAKAEDPPMKVSGQIHVFHVKPSAHGDDGDESHESQESWQDVDLDNMSYEELIALGEAVGTQSKGLTPNLIAALPHATFSHVHTTGEDRCVICQFDYVDGDVLSALPCKHCYHADCIKSWLEINKVCPICSAEVTWTTVENSVSNLGSLRNIPKPYSCFLNVSSSEDVQAK